MPSFRIIILIIKESPPKRLSNGRRCIVSAAICDRVYTVPETEASFRLILFPSRSLALVRSDQTLPVLLLRVSWGKRWRNGLALHRRNRYRIQGPEWLWLVSVGELSWTSFQSCHWVFGY